MSGNYPRLLINLNHFKTNVEKTIDRCKQCNVEITGVIKGVNGLPEVTETYISGGVKSIGTSRLEQFEGIRERHPDISLMLIRTPMLSEIEDVVRLTDISLNTEIQVIRALDEEAKRQGKIHQVLLMIDVGDLREGFFDEEELISACVMAESQLDNIYLAGLGTNVGCYGAIEPTVETLEKLAAAADKIEGIIGRPLDIISGGASSSLMRVWDKDMPAKINHLRIGGEVMLAHTNRVVYGYDMSGFYFDAFRLEAEIASIVDVNSQGKKDRRKAVLDIGLIDYCHTDALYPVDKSVKISDVSHDYTVVDIEDSKEDYKLGDILTFDLSYGALVYLTKSKSVSLEFIDK